MTEGEMCTKCTRREARGRHKERYSFES